MEGTTVVQPMGEAVPVFEHQEDDVAFRLAVARGYLVSHSGDFDWAPWDLDP
jgi:hypothetical protein